jgi:stress-induced morphogen
MDFGLLEELIVSNISDAKVQITDLTGSQDHLGLLIVSDEFKGKMLIAQHQMIMDILKEKLKEEIHAVQIKTMTHDQATERGINV